MFPFVPSLMPELLPSPTTLWDAKCGVTAAGYETEVGRGRSRRTRNVTGDDRVIKAKGATAVELIDAPPNPFAVVLLVAKLSVLARLPVMVLLRTPRRPELPLMKMAPPF